LSTTNTQGRAPLRALVGAAVIGSLAGLALGASYMGGSLANAMNVRAKAERLTGAAAERYSEAALIDAAGGLDSSALAIARRHDPYTVAGGAFRDRAATAMAARLEREAEKRRDAAGLRRTVENAAAQPFRMAGGAWAATRDLDCLAQAVYYEARGEGLAGMRAVAQVVLNRVRHPAFPKTICGVVYQGAAKRTGCQFSFTCDGSMRRGKEPGAWRRARDVAAAAMGGFVFADVGNATHFHTLGVSPRWRNTLLRVAQIGTHIFYRFGGRGGASDSFRYTPRPSSPMDVRPVYAGMAPVPTTGDGSQPYKILFTGVGGPAPDAKPVEPASAPAAAPVTTPAPAKPAEAPAPKAEAPAPAPAPTASIETPAA